MRFQKLSPKNCAHSFTKYIVIVKKIRPHESSVDKSTFRRTIWNYLIIQKEKKVVKIYSNDYYFFFLIKNVLKLSQNQLTRKNKLI